MGARHSLYKAGPEDVVDPARRGSASSGPVAAPAAARPPPIAVPDPAPSAAAAAASRSSGGGGGGGAGGLVSRLGLPLCSTVDTVDHAATHPHSPLPSPAANGLTDVWIIAGQSNAVGDNMADGLPMPAAAQPLPGLVLSFEGGLGTAAGGAGRWVDAAPNIHLGLHDYDDADSCGPGIAFARTLVSLGLSARVALVPTARGSTNLFHDWRAVPGSSSGSSSAGGAPGSHSNGGAAPAPAAPAAAAASADNAASGVRGGSPAGYFYGAMVARVKAALATPLPGGGACRLRGMIWVQGEADAEERHGPGPAEAYAANFAAFVAAARRDLSAYHAQLSVIVAVMAVRKRECFPHLGLVRQAQLGAALPGLVRIDMAGFEFFEEYGPYHVHLTKDGACAMGAAMAHAYYSAVVRAGLPRGPPGACAVNGLSAAAVPCSVASTPAAGAASASFRQQQHPQLIAGSSSSGGNGGGPAVAVGGVVGVAAALATIPSSDSPRSGASAAATPLAPPVTEVAEAEPDAAADAAPERVPAGGVETQVDVVGHAGAQQEADGDLPPVVGGEAEKAEGRSS